jgi:pimeloyl-ACP methyl ester carboxylesterase
MSGLMYNLWYYKNFFLQKIFPDYVASSINDLYYTPRQVKQPQFEADFQNSYKYNIIKVPTKDYKEKIKKFIDNEAKYKITRIPELPDEINVMEFLPEKNSPKRDFSILCSHGWEGRGTNFYKFIIELNKRGFRVLCPDHPLHGSTGGVESGCNVFAFSLNCVLNYIDTPVYILVHSLSNGSFCMNYYLCSQEILNKIKGFVGIGVPDKFVDHIIYFGKLCGMDDYTLNLFKQKNTERLGLDVNLFVVSEVLENLDIPILIVHDEKDKEVPISWAENVSKHIKRQEYKIGDKEYSCFHKTSGLGHRRILRDDDVVQTVCNFISDGKSIK